MKKEQINKKIKDLITWMIPILIRGDNVGLAWRDLSAGLHKKNCICIYWLLSFWTSIWTFQILVWVKKTSIMYFLMC